MQHDLRQLRTGVPSGVPPRRELQMARGGSFCPKCGADNYYTRGFYEDDPTYCVRCEEPTSEIGQMAVDGQYIGREFGDDAMDGAVALPDRELSILYGWNDDSPLGGNYEGSHDNDIACLQ